MLYVIRILGFKRLEDFRIDMEMFYKFRNGSYTFDEFRNLSETFDRFRNLS